MRIVPIFVSETSDEGVWSIQLDGQNQSEFDKFFSSVNDPEWLYYFFEANKEDLLTGFWKKMSVSDAVLLTINEAQLMEDTLYEYAQNGFADIKITLQHLFKPLNNYEYAMAVHQKSKARVNQGWLRLYGLRLSANCFLITGGGVKLTKDMRRPHLEDELKKLELTKRFLQHNEINYPEDLNFFEDE
jgi:hypothetical protein